MTGHVQIVEVGPRDGFQSVGPIISTPDKIDVINRLYGAGVRRMEATSFVSTKAVPQLADAGLIVEAVRGLSGLDAQVLIPTARYAEQALASGATHLSAVLSVSEAHNLSNLRRTRAQSVSDIRDIVALLPADGALRLNLATAFDCPYDGRVPASQVCDLLAQLLAIAPRAEIALCDTTGRADPAQVTELYSILGECFPDVSAWAFHGHDTYGLGSANAYAAWTAGVRVFDASVAGLGGCPFAPGATGNVATEDLVWMFDSMGYATGIRLAELVDVALDVTALPGSQTGGRVRNAILAGSCANAR